MKKYILNSWLFCLPFFAMAQSRDILDEKANADIPQVADFQLNRGLIGFDLPAQYSLKSYCPTPNDSKQVASTLFQSICYGAMTMIYAIQHQLSSKKEIDKIAFSALYPYIQVAKDCDKGTTFQAGFEFLKQKGTPFFVRFETTSSESGNCMKVPTEIHHQLARQHLIKDAIKLFGTEESLRMRKYYIQRSLVAKQPVIVGLRLPDNLFTFHDSTKNRTTYYQPQGEGHGGTTFVVVGYDENSVELMNHWGTKWGNNGFCKMKYNDFFNYCVVAYRIEFDTRTRQPSNEVMYGRFEWLTPVHGAMQPVSFELKAGKYYEAIQKSNLGQQFQLSIKDLQKGKYLYLFCQNSSGAIDWLWPNLPIEKDISFKESPLIPYDNLDFLVPNAEQAFAKSGEGSDMIFLMYSDKMLNINDLKIRLKAMEKDSRTVTALEKFEKAFQGWLIDWDKVKYELSRPAFKTPATDKIVPLIFKVI
jgi:Papain family cysteine protease